jgi:hypothetical protein
MGEWDQSCMNRCWLWCVWISGKGLLIVRILVERRGRRCYWRGFKRRHWMRAYGGVVFPLTFRTTELGLAVWWFMVSQTIETQFSPFAVAHLSWQSFTTLQLWVEWGPLRYIHRLVVCPGLYLVVWCWFPCVCVKNEPVVLCLGDGSVACIRLE